MLDLSEPKAAPEYTEADVKYLMMEDTYLRMCKDLGLPESDIAEISKREDDNIPLTRGEIIRRAFDAGIHFLQNEFPYHGRGRAEIELKDIDPVFCAFALLYFNQLNAIKVGKNETGKYRIGKKAQVIEVESERQGPMIRFIFGFQKEFTNKVETIEVWIPMDKSRRIPLITDNTDINGQTKTYYIVYESVGEQYNNWQALFGPVQVKSR